MTRKIETSDQRQRRIEPTDVAMALGANLAERESSGRMDLISLAELGTRFLRRRRNENEVKTSDLRICPVPLADEDLKTLEKLASQMKHADGKNISVGELVGEIVHLHLGALNAG